MSDVQDDPRPVRPAKRPDLTKALARCLTTALRMGRVRMAGALGGVVTQPHKEPGWDSRKQVDKGVERGFLAPGEFAGTYVITDKGRDALAQWSEFSAAYKAWTVALAEWRKRDTVRRAKAREEAKRARAAAKAAAIDAQYHRAFGGAP